MHRHRLLALTLLAACHDGTQHGPGLPAPVIEAAVVTANPHNVLSAVVSVRARDADSLAVLFRLEGDLADSVTPAVIGSADSALPVLGLLPQRRYVMRALAFGAGQQTVGDSLSFETGSLPADLPSYAAGGTSPSPGYVVFATGRYGLVIDNTGRVVWYRAFANNPGLAFMAQPNGRYVTRAPTPAPGDREPWLELDVLGEVRRALDCAGGLGGRPHDMISEPDGSWWLMCDEARTMDLTALGGVASAKVTGTVVQHVGADGSLLFQWSPFDHFALTDLDSAERVGANVNWTHGNAIDLDAGGDLYVSFRSLGEITRIDVPSGTVVWRLGGRRNQFTFEGGDVPPFARQHGVRVCSGGALLLLDNVGDPAESRGERYLVDGASYTARLDRSYRPGPGVVTQIGGSVQDLPGGRTLVSFGTAGRVAEYDASGAEVWRIEGNPGYVFRAQRIRSLYQPGVGSSR